MDTTDNVDMDKAIEEEEDIDVDNGIGSKSTKVRKVPVHEAACHNLLSKGIEKMKLMNLPVVRYRKNKRLKREQTAISDSIYKNMINANENSICNILIDELTHDSDGNVFGTWDNTISELI